MKLTFLGTRGNIEEKSARHARHTCTMVGFRRKRVLMDCGEDWREMVHSLGLHAVVLTHAHPDHAFGLKDGAPCPVFAAPPTIQLLESFPIKDLHAIEPRRPMDIHGLNLEAFPLEHSIRCPAVGYRIAAGLSTVFYAPDVAYIPDRDVALAQVAVYIGDGATAIRSMVRKRGAALIGHVPMRTQITWCRKAGVPRAVFTHCGKHIVAGDESAVLVMLNEYAAAEPTVEIAIAHDGMELALR